MKIASSILFAVTLALAIAWLVVSHQNKASFQEALSEATRGRAIDHTVGLPEDNNPAAVQKNQDQLRDSMVAATKHLQATASLPPTQATLNQQKLIAAQIAQLNQQQAAEQYKLSQMQAEQDAEKEQQLQASIDKLVNSQKEDANKKYQAMPIIISSFLGLAALFIILSKKYDAETMKWATGTLGVIVGFWLGGS